MKRRHRRAQERKAKRNWKTNGGKDLESEGVKQEIKNKKMIERRKKKKKKRKKKEREKEKEKEKEEQEEKKSI